MIQEDRNIRGIDIFKAIMCFLIIKNVILYFPYAEEFYGLNAIVPYKFYQNYLFTIGNPLLYFPFHMEYAPKIFMLLVFTFALISMFTQSNISLFILWWLLLIGKIRNTWISDGSDNVIMVMLPMISLCYLKPITKETFINTTRIIYTKYLRIALMLQVSMIYFVSFFYKAQGELWQNGTALYYIMRVNEFNMMPLNVLLTENHYFVIFATYFGMFFQIAFSFLIWFKPTKWIMMFLGCLFHIGIWIFLQIDNFSWIMIATYAIFVTDNEYVQIKEQTIKWKQTIINLWTLSVKLISR